MVFRYAAKQSGMKKSKTNIQLTPQLAGLVEPPAYPKSANEVIRQLKKAMDRVECQAGLELAQIDFGRLIGAPKSTIHDWYHGNLAAPIKHFLCALERLNENQRTELLRELCRDCPRLQHPRLAFDPQAVNSLSALLAQSTGLTFIVGAEDLQTFLITAWGNSATRLNPSLQVCGLDLHKPDLFVPVSGVLYLGNPNDSAQVRELARSVWKQIEDSHANLVLLNRVWSAVPELRNKIVACARNRHVILADQSEAVAPMLRISNRVPTNVVTITAAPKHQIRVVIEAASPVR